MPIYSYRCEECGHSKDVLQKMSDPLLTVCPACGAPAFKKQLTAAGFQLKGSGWYVTDFRDGNKGATGKDGASKEPDKSAESASSDGKSPAAAGADKAASTPAKVADSASPATAPSAAPAAAAPAPAAKTISAP